jgi:hypothetical protein
VFETITVELTLALELALDVDVEEEFASACARVENPIWANKAAPKIRPATAADFLTFILFNYLFFDLLNIKLSKGKKRIFQGAIILREYATIIGKEQGYILRDHW